MAQFGLAELGWITAALMTVGLLGAACNDDQEQAPPPVPTPTGGSGTGGHAGGTGGQAAQAGLGGQAGQAGQGGGISCDPGSTRGCYDGDPAHENVGICNEGTQICSPQGTAWGECLGQGFPGVEDCSAPEDEDCDGQACSEPAWATAIGGTSYENPNGIGFDTQGNVVVAGTASDVFDIGLGDCDGAGSFDTTAFVLKLSASGSPQWCRASDATDFAFAEAGAFDAAGDVYATGHFGETTLSFGGTALSDHGGHEAFVVKLRGADGGYVWQVGLSDATGSGFKYPQDMAIDAAGQIWVVGYYDGQWTTGQSATDGEALFIRRFTLAGSADGSWRFDSPGSQRALSLAIDSSGDLVIGGTFTEQLSLDGTVYTAPVGSTYGFFARLDSASPTTVLASHAFGDGPASTQLVADVAVDAAGADAIVVAGSFNQTLYLDSGESRAASGIDGFIAAYSSGGAHQWALHFGDSNSQYVDAVAVSSEHEVMFAGQFDGAMTIGTGPEHTATDPLDTFVGKLSSAGGHIWSKHFPTRAHTDPLRERVHVALNADDHLGLAGVMRRAVDFGTGGALPHVSGEDLFVALFYP